MRALEQTAHGSIHRILLVPILVLIGWPLSAPANVMPVYEDLRRTESAHFIYIYQVSLAPQVLILSRLCEEAYDLLTPALHWAPRGKTIILYADTMDAHVLSMDAQYGADAFLSAIFGRVRPTGDFLSLVLAACTAPPGFLAPIWYREGLAIWAETEFSSSGRGRTSVADMIMRMPFADQRLLSADQWNLALPEWPYGEAAYLYGMKTIEYAQALSA